MTIVEMPEDEPWRPKNRVLDEAGDVGARAPGAAPKRPDDDPDRIVYGGGRARLFWLAFGRMAITILTLGVGRFWMITRLRRHYWSSIRLGGDPLEYTGRAGEKLIGFLIAVVILAAYLMIVNLVLTFVGLSFFQGNPLALQLPLLALLPFVPWAQYRARRYILSRTRWRGIRFGVDPGAWGYVGQAFIWNLATFATLGFLYPLAQYKLAQYVTNRSYYGDLRFEQRGGWVPLLKSWLWVWLPIPVFIVGGAFAFFSFLDADTLGSVFDDPDGGLGAELTEDVFAGLGLVVGGFVLYLWIIIAGIHHQVFSFRHLNSNRILAGKSWITFKLSTWAVIGIYIVGGMAISIGVAIVAGISVTLSTFALVATGLDPTVLEDVLEWRFPGLDGVAALGVLLAGYLPAIATYSALSHAFITHPLIKETSSFSRIHDLESAGRARQRAHDHQSEAGGFADALGADAGGAF